MNGNRSRDIVRGLKVGVGFGLIYCAIALVIYGVDGSRPFSENNVNVGSAMGLYLFAGVTAGVIVGFFRRDATSKIRAILVGILAAIPLSIGIGVMLDGLPQHWDASTWLVYGLCAVVFGSAGANTLWGKFEG